MIKILHLADIHLGSGFSHGRINPETGRNTRLEDFICALSLCIDRALAEPVDLVLFGGDAFPDATPAPYIQQAFAQQFRRLVDAEIPIVLLVGNHDQHSQGQGGASLSIYRTLGVPSVIVGDRLETHTITTPAGAIQVITLPWLTRSTLLTRPETENLSLAQVNELLIDRLRIALEGEIRQLDPSLPTVLLGHLMTDTARFGAERFLAAGKNFTVPMALLTRSNFDYVALGHVHRHQILCEQPYVVYPGSIERVDFSEEQETKGFVLASIPCGGRDAIEAGQGEAGQGEAGQTEIEFCPLPTRRFLTLRLDVSTADDPQAALTQGIAATAIEEAVVRLIYQVRADQLAQIDNSALHEILAAAHTYTIHPELVSQLARPRMPELSGGSVEPLEALSAYLAHQSELAELAEEMLAAAQGLLSAEPIEWPEEDAATAISTAAEPDAQLRLL